MRIDVGLVVTAEVEVSRDPEAWAKALAEQEEQAPE